MNFKQLSCAALFFSLINLNSFGALKEESMDVNRNDWFTRIEKERSWQNLLSEYRKTFPKDDTPEAAVFLNCAGHGKVELLEQALAVRAVTIDCRNNTNTTTTTPLIVAAERGHLETVRFLLARGANQSLRGHFNRTALEVSVAYLGKHHNRLESSRIKDYETIIDILGQQAKK